MAGANTGAISSGRRNYVVVLVLLITLVSFLDRQVLSILVEPIKRDLRLSDGQMGALTGLFFFLFYAAAGLPMARIADRYDKRKVMSVCIVGWSVANGLAGATTNFIQLAICRTMAGIGDAGCSPAITSVVAELFPPAKRPGIFAAVSAASAVGIGISLFLGGTLVEHMSWRVVMFVLALPGLLLAILVWTTMPPLAQTKKEDLPPMLATLTGLWRIPTYRALTVIIFFASASGFALIAWTAAMFIRTHGLSPSKAGLIVGACMSGGFLVGNMLCGYIANRLAARDPRFLPAILGASLIANVALALVALASSDLTMAVVAFAVMLVSGGFWAPIALTLTMGLARPQIRAVTASTFGIILSVGGAVGPVVVGIFADRLTPIYGVMSIRYAMAISLGGYFIAAIASAFVFKSLRNDLLTDEPITIGH